MLSTNQEMLITQKMFVLESFVRPPEARADSWSFFNWSIRFSIEIQLKSNDLWDLWIIAYEPRFEPPTPAIRLDMLRDSHKIETY